MISNLFQILGSLGVFLFGMIILSDGLQKVAGDKLRGLMAKMTSNRFMGLLTGTFVTCLVQSSSASTVMIVSFANAGILKLRQAIGMIMGANLGTTTTFWIVSYFGFKFSLSKIALPCVGVGMVLYYLKRSGKIREVGETLVGFGLLFLGLSLLKNAVPDVKSNPEMLEFVKSYTDLGFLSIIYFLIGGIILTIVVQSSSVAGAVTLTLAYKGWFGFDIAAAIILGENIGTTITANLAAIGTNREAKRAAFAHFLFNVIGVIWMLILFYPFLGLVDRLIAGAATDVEAMPMHMAAFHTLFNFVNICLLIGFIPWIANFVEKCITGKSKEKNRVQYLAHGNAQSGEMYLFEAEQGVKDLSNTSLKMFRQVIEFLQLPPATREPEMVKIKEMEEESDKQMYDITKFLALCTSQNLSPSKASNVTNMFIIVGELEHICDNCNRIAKTLHKQALQDIILDEKIQERLVSLFGQVEHFMQYSQRLISIPIGYKENDDAEIHHNGIKNSMKELHKAIRLTMNDPAKVESGLLAIEVLSNLKRIASQNMNILQGQLDATAAQK
jgi:phosphate:Na+ symporter